MQVGNSETRYLGQQTNSVFEHPWRTDSRCCQPGPHGFHQGLGPSHVTPARRNGAPGVLDQAASNQVRALPEPTRKRETQSERSVNIHLVESFR